MSSSTRRVGRVPVQARTAAPVLRRCACGAQAGPAGECESCRRGRLQRSASSGTRSGDAGAAPSIVHDVLRSPGQPLDAGTRAFMEPRFGHSFANVRVHADAHAAESAGAVGARAYAVGSDVVFGSGMYSSGSTAGQRLIAHELAHVVQQSGTGGRMAASLEVGPTDAPEEREAEAAADAVMRGAAATAAADTAPRIRRFESPEHKSLGDTATGGAMVDVGGNDPATAFQLTHGDVVMLSGDYFAPADLFRLGAIPGRNGTAVGTRDEVIWALKDAMSTAATPDPRFTAGGTWASWTFSDDVRAAVTARFQALAAANAAHFVAPRGRGPTGEPNAPHAGETNAGASYRTYHEQALRMAYDAGRTPGTTQSHALAMEAAAQHFLTDSFSAGHLTTEIADMREYWRGVYPLFFYNLLHKIALDTAVRMNAQTSNITSAVATVQMMYEGIMDQVNGMAATLPEVGLGDLLARVFHDYDNEFGVAVAGGGRVYGDNRLDQADPNNVTRGRAQAAILAGNREVAEAFNLGRGGGAQLTDDQLHAQVRTASGAPATQYLPETLVPRPDATAPRQNWRAASIEALWPQHVVGNSGPTVGARIGVALQPGQEIRKQLDDLAQRFPPVDTHFTGNLRPRQAYLDGFLAPLVANPWAGIWGIVHWAPNYGLRSVDRDDISLATGQELATSHRLGGMTLQARESYVRELIGGSVAADEEELVVQIFEAAPPADRPLLYQRVEGHAWTGDWIEGWTVSDDDLWNALSRPRLARLRTLINAGWTRPAGARP